MTETVTQERLAEIEVWAETERADCLADDMPISAEYYADVLRIVEALRQSDTRIEGGGKEPPGIHDDRCATRKGHPCNCASSAFARVDGPVSPTPEHVEGDVLSVGLEVVAWRCLNDNAMECNDRYHYSSFAKTGARWQKEGQSPRALTDHAIASATLSAAKSRIQQAEREIARQQALVSSSEAERIRSCSELMARATTAEAQLADAVKVLEAVGHIGVDFGYGPYVLEEKHIEAARTFLSTIGEKPDAE